MVAMSNSSPGGLQRGKTLGDSLLAYSPIFPVEVAVEKSWVAGLLDLVNRCTHGCCIRATQRTAHAWSNMGGLLREALGKLECPIARRVPLMRSLRRLSRPDARCLGSCTWCRRLMLFLNALWLNFRNVDLANWTRDIWRLILLTNVVFGSFLDPPTRGADA